jgi:very-short-patch-repair endonuclease
VVCYPFPEGKGIVLTSIPCEDGLSFSPSGETGEGFYRFALQSRHVTQNIITEQKVTKEKLQRATPALAGGAREELRREMTPAEKILWEELRANKLGVHFRRQQVIQGFVIDFYCHKAELVVEVDGDIHDLQKEEDERREKVLRELGLRIVRFRTDEVVKNLSAVVEKILEQIS